MIALALSVVGTLIGGQAGQADDALAALPDVTVTYYDVEGADAPAIRAAIDAARPTDAHDGRRVDALTHWSMRWRWRGYGSDRCDLDSAEVTARAEVTLPRLAHPEALAPEVMADWSRYMAAVKAHEAGHVRNAYDHRGDVLAAIRGATCATAAAAAAAALQAIRDRDLAYDRDTGHGASEGAVFP